MAVDAKSQSLSQLRAVIIDEWLVKQWKEVWFFPQWNSIRGWLGTGDIFFVGPNPSTGWFPSKNDEFLYRELKLLGFENAHLTDAIKLRAKGEDVDSLIGNHSLMDRQKDYFRQELEILKPVLIVPMGTRAERIVTEWVGSEYKVEFIPHYVPRFVGKEDLPRFQEAFHQSLQAIRARL